MKRLCVFLLLALSACGGADFDDPALTGPDDVTLQWFTACENYVISEEFEGGLPELSMIALDNAIERWNDAMGFEIFTYGGAQGQLERGGAFVDIQVVPEIEEGDYSGIAWNLLEADGCGCRVHIRADHEGDLKTYIHELGHCLGLDHSTKAFSVMNPDVQVTNITPEMVHLVERNLDTY